MLFSQIPLELQQLRQWICWREVETIDNDVIKKTKIPIRPLDGKPASVTNPLDWTDFQTAVASAARCHGIGFVFTAADPYTGIDLDNKENDAERRGEHQKIIQYLNSYTEVSPSGLGFHVIVKAALPGGGKRRFGIEIYDRERYFTFTGNRTNEIEPQQRQEQALAVFQHVSKASSAPLEYVASSQPETISDSDVINRAKLAANGDKFNRLWGGDWRTDYGQCSSSDGLSCNEADFALINIIGFYSRNFTQTVRLFRASGLGQRDKAKRGAYVGGMVQRAFDRMPPAVPIAHIGSGPWFDARAWAPWAPKLSAVLDHTPYVPPVHTTPPAALVPATVNMDLLPPIPGLVGDLMRHTYASAAYPVAEVALAAALSLASTLFGRTHRFGTNGLTLYILVLAKTSTGKSFGYQAHNAIRNELLRLFDNPQGGPQYKQRAEFVANLMVKRFGSAPGMAQHMLANPSTLFHADEFVKTLNRITSNFASNNDRDLYTELLSLTDASKPGAIYVETAYSNRTPASANSEKKTLRKVVSACLTIFGTGTPAEFYDNLSSGMLNEGLIPRFLILDYTGYMPEENENPAPLTRELMQKIESVVNTTFRKSDLMTGNLSDYINIECDPYAFAALKEWKAYCRKQILFEQAGDSPAVGIWSRGAGRVGQIAALIAAGENPHAPMITLQHVTLARGIVEKSLSHLTGKIRRGETEGGDTRLEAEIRGFISRVFDEGSGFLGPRAVNSQLLSQGFIQLAAMKNYLCRLATFKRHRLGESRSFDDTIANMVNMGALERKDFKTENGRIVKAVKLVG